MRNKNNFLEQILCFTTKKRSYLQSMAHSTIMRRTPKTAVAIMTIRAIELLFLLKSEESPSSTFVSKSYSIEFSGREVTGNSPIQ